MASYVNRKWLKVTTHGSVSGSHLFNLFVNDLIIEEENKFA